MIIALLRSPSPLSLATESASRPLGVAKLGSAPLSSRNLTDRIGPVIEAIIKAVAVDELRASISAPASSNTSMHSTQPWVAAFMRGVTFILSSPSFADSPRSNAASIALTFPFFAASRIDNTLDAPPGGVVVTTDGLVAATGIVISTWPVPSPAFSLIPGVPLPGVLFPGGFGFSCVTGGGSDDA